MAAGQYNFEIEQGADFSKTFTWKNSAGVAIAIAGYIFRMMARNDYADTTPVITLSTVSPPGGIAIVGDGTAGQFTVSMTAAATALLNFSNVQYDLEAVAPGVGGITTRLLEGTITLSREVTK